MAEPTSKQPQHRISKPRPKKLQRLPPNAKVTKRPLLHPAIASPYAGVNQQKTVYVSARTPFLSAIKRVKKLLHLSDKRLVQSATTLAKQKTGGKRKRNAGREDEIVDIATEVERLKGKKRKTDSGAVGVGDDEAGVVGEEVTLKGSGKAIARVMEMALWFQQREEYLVRLRTGTAGAIDDIEIDETNDTVVQTSSGDDEGEGDAAGGARPSAVPTTGDADLQIDEIEGGGGISLQTNEPDDAKIEKDSKPVHISVPKEPIPETRIRYTSVLEVAVSLR